MSTYILIWGRCNLKRSRRTVICLPVYKISSLKLTLPTTLQLKTLDFLQQTITMNENAGRQITVLRERFRLHLPHIKIYVLIISWFIFIKIGIHIYVLIYWLIVLFTQYSDFLQQTITMNENAQWQMIKDSVLFALSSGFSVSLFHFYLKNKSTRDVLFCIFWY
jgi:hypothetical protein